MFDFNSAKTAYDSAAAAGTKLFDLNTKAVQSFFSFQTAAAEEAVNYALSSVAKVGEVKSPKDLEVAVKDNQSQLQDLFVKNSKEYLELYKSYATGVSGVFADVTAQGAKVAKSAAVAK